MDFIHPQYWLLVFALPIPGIVLLLIYRRTRHIVFGWFKPKNVIRFYPALKNSLRFAGLLFLVIGMTGPAWESGTGESEVLNRDIYFLLDVSGSMNTEDVRPSRFELAQETIEDLINELKGDRIGLISFTDQAFVQCPLTRDHQTVLKFLSVLKPDQYKAQGTNFRNALHMAFDRLEATDGAQPGKGQLVILMSDGEDQGETFASVLERLKRLSIKIIPVGIGTTTGGPVPEWVNGKKRGYKQHPEGGTVYSSLKDEALLNIARVSGTEYIHLSRKRSSYKELKEEITTISAYQSALREETVRENAFQWFLLAGFLIFLISLFMIPVRS